MLKRCPGTKDLVDPKIIIRACPACGEEVEFLDYETEAKCYKCGRTLHREATPSCVIWCEHALKCIVDLEERKLITQSKAEELEKIAKAAKAQKPNK